MIEFTLTDADGVPHVYTLALHPAREGQKILWLLMAGAAEPLGRLIQGALSGSDLVDKVLAAGAGAKLSDLLDLDLGAVLAAVDFAKFGADLKSSIRTLPMDELAANLLRHMLRDGKQLEDPVVFDAAYRGNYGEMLQALWKSVEANRFLSLFGTL